MGTFTRKCSTGLRQAPPATTEKLVYIYSNREAAAAASDDKWKMFTWDNEWQTCASRTGGVGGVGRRACSSYR